MPAILLAPTLLLAALAIACSGASYVAPTASDPPGGGAQHPANPEPSPNVLRPAGGTSDGVSCEEAQATNVDEVDMKGEGQVDLTSHDYGQILNAGSYLEPCTVPHDAKIDVCVAVRNGAAVGVTVMLDPQNPEIELCIAKQVRALTFPSHPKMDIAKVHF